MKIYTVKQLTLGLVAGIAVAISQAGAGSIEGRVTFEGRVPAMRPIDMGGDPGCAAHDGKQKFFAMLLVGPDKGIANVLVQVTKGLPEKEYPVPEEPVELTQAGCIYTPHILTMRAGQPIIIRNPDGLSHNVHVLSKINRERNWSMAATKDTLRKTFNKAEGLFTIKCDVHKWMRAYGAVFDHPFYTVTDANGSFEITGLPSGKYTVQAWQEDERLGVREQEVTVPETGTTKADFVYKR